MTNDYCIVIPHFKHVPQLERFLPTLARANLPLLIVDDGSGAAVVQQLNELIRPHEWVELITRKKNGGKGAATVTGLQNALEAGYSHVILVDADGQHDPADVVRIYQQSKEETKDEAKTEPQALYSGQPHFGDDIPSARRYGREITNVLARIEAGNWALKDAMCGLRVYPIDITLTLARECGTRVRMEMDTELLVRACWHGYEVRYIDTNVVYPEEGASHFRMGKDNIRMALMHCRLLLEALVRVPISKLRRTQSHSGNSHDSQ